MHLMPIVIALWRTVNAISSWSSGFGSVFPLRGLKHHSIKISDDLINFIHN